MPAAEALRDDAAVEALLASLPQTPGRRSTAHRVDTLRWRYAGFEPLGYHAVLAGPTAADGLAIARLKERGRAKEVAIVEVLAPGHDPALQRHLVRRVRTAFRGDYCARVVTDRLPRMAFVRLPGQGPLLVWRALNETVKPDLDAWRLSLGDIELF